MNALFSYENAATITAFRPVTLGEGVPDFRVAEWPATAITAHAVGIGVNVKGFWSKNWLLHIAVNLKANAWCLKGKMEWPLVKLFLIPT